MEITNVGDLQNVPTHVMSLTLKHFINFNKQSFKLINNFMKNHSNLKKLEIKNIFIGATNKMLFKEFLQHISKFSLVTLKFININMGTETYKMFLNYIKKMKTVIKLDLTNNQINNCMFKDLICNTIHITHLKLRSNIINELFELDFSKINKKLNKKLNLTHLNVSNNYYINCVPKCWCEQLTYLNLNNNRIDEIECYESFFSLQIYKFTSWRANLDNLNYMQKLLDFLKRSIDNNYEVTCITLSELDHLSSDEYNEILLQIIKLLPQLGYLKKVYFNYNLIKKTSVEVLDVLPYTTIEKIDITVLEGINNIRIVFDTILRSPNLKSILISVHEISVLIKNHPDLIEIFEHMGSITKYELYDMLYDNDPEITKMFTNIIKRNRHNMKLKQMSLIYL
jgi:hypothetical protein